MSTSGLTVIREVSPPPPDPRSSTSGSAEAPGRFGPRTSPAAATSRATGAAPMASRVSPGGELRPENQALGRPAAWLAATNRRAATTNTKVVGIWNPSFPRAAPMT
jgi:hypothetical protein